MLACYCVSHFRLQEKNQRKERIHHFSAIKTIKSLFDTLTVEPNLHVFNGFRVISIIWVVLGCTYEFVQLMIPVNSDYMLYIMTKPTWFAIISGATQSVDTFFAIGGFLTALSCARMFEEKKHRNIKTILKCILLRFLRLTPIVGIIILLYLYVCPAIFGGPLHNFWEGSF